MGGPQNPPLNVPPWRVGPVDEPGEKLSLGPTRELGEKVFTESEEFFYYVKTSFHPIYFLFYVKFSDVRVFSLFVW